MKPMPNLLSLSTVTKLAALLALGFALSPARALADAGVKWPGWRQGTDDRDVHSKTISGRIQK